MTDYEVGGGNVFADLGLPEPEQRLAEAETRRLAERCEALEAVVRELIPLAERSGSPYSTRDDITAWQKRQAAVLARAKKLIGGDDG